MKDLAHGQVQAKFVSCEKDLNIPGLNYNFLSFQFLFKVTLRRVMWCAQLGQW